MLLRLSLCYKKKEKFNAKILLQNNKQLTTIIHHKYCSNYRNLGQIYLIQEYLYN